RFSRSWTTAPCARFAAVPEPTAAPRRFAPRAWLSLRLRVPLALSALVALVLAAFLWVAFREVEQALVQSGGARAQVAADQLASLLAQSAQQRVRDLQHAAANPDVRAYVK